MHKLICIVLGHSSNLLKMEEHRRRVNAFELYFLFFSIIFIIMIMIILFTVFILVIFFIPQFCNLSFNHCQLFNAIPGATLPLPTWGGGGVSLW